MIGKYDGEFYHVSDEIDEAQNRTIWRFGPFDGAVPRKIGDTTVYELDVPAEKVHDTVQFLRFTARWKEHDITIEDIVKEHGTSQSNYLFSAKIITCNQVFANQHGFIPDQSDRGESVRWCKWVRMDECSHFQLEMMLEDDRIVHETLGMWEAIVKFDSMVLNLRSLPTSILDPNSFAFPDIAACLAPSPAAKSYANIYTIRDSQTRMFMQNLNESIFKMQQDILVLNQMREQQRKLNEITLILAQIMQEQEQMIQEPEQMRKLNEINTIIRNAMRDMRDSMLEYFLGKI